MTSEQQIYLTENALSIYEYPAFKKKDASDIEETSDKYLEWKRKTTGDDAATFEKLLIAHGFDAASAPKLFCMPKISEAAGWVTELTELLSLMPVTLDDVLSRLKYNPIKEKPDYYLSPVLFYMEQKLTTVFKRDCISEKARMDIMENGFCLIKFLFKRFTIRELNKKAGTLLPQPIENLSAHYDVFTEEMLRNGYENAFIEFPALGRALIDSIQLWAAFIEEFTGNLCKEMPGEIARLKLSTGDTHNYGRSVTIVEYTDGTKLVYKPQNGELFAAYGELLDFLAETGIISPMKYAKLLGSYKNHCYVEFIEHSPITYKDGGADRYYHRAGQLLCIFHALGTEDIHSENIIAHGEYPVVVDLETLLTAVVENFIDIRDKPDYGNGVMNSLMLMLHGNIRGGIALTHSESSNVPFFQDGSEVNFNSVCANILDGFKFTYRKVLLHKDLILRKLNIFRNCQFRSIIRSTQIYYNLLMHIRYIDYLKDGLARSFETQRMFSAYKKCDDVERLKKLSNIFEEECKAVLRGEIPLFNVNADSRCIVSGEKELYDGYYEKSPLSHAQESLMKMGDEDLNVQNKIIQLVLQSTTKRDYLLFKQSIDEVPLLTNEQMIEEAEIIAGKINEHLIFQNGKPYFLTVHTVEEGAFKGQNNLGAAGIGFYHGVSGIAMFFGALYSVTRNQQYKNTAVQIVKSVCDEYSYIPQITQAGIADGVGGIALVLSYLADYLDEPEYHNTARKIIADYADLNTVEKTDYLSGLSGYIIAAVKVGADEQFIRQGADRLVKLRISYDGRNSWNSGFSKKPLIGMGHGLSGIALAMSKAYEMFKNKEYLECVIDALKYENHFYDEHNGWPDFRDDRSGYMNGFCSGAPGVGLARLAMSDVSREIDAYIAADISRAAYHVKKHQMGIKDDVCCGNVSGISFLITLGKTRNDEAALVGARKRLSWIIARKDSIGIYGNDTDSNLDVSGFFCGISGIGYEILRLASNCVKAVF